MNWLDLILFAPHFLVGCCYGGRQKIILGLSRSTNYITMSMGWRTDKILANYSCQLCRQKTEGLVSLLMRGFSRGQTAIPPSPPVQLSSPPLPPLLSLLLSPALTQTETNQIWKKANKKITCAKRSFLTYSLNINQITEDWRKEILRCKFGYWTSLCCVLSQSVDTLDILFWSWCFSRSDSWECFVKTNESSDNRGETKEYRPSSRWWKVLVRFTYF